jgi:hypothetical protein
LECPAAFYILLMGSTVAAEKLAMLSRVGTISISFGIRVWMSPLRIEGLL